MSRDRIYVWVGLLWFVAALADMVVRGDVQSWWLLPLGFAMMLLVALLTVVLTPPATTYQAPPGSSVALTVSRHGDWPPILMRLQLAGIEAQLVEEPRKSARRRLAHALFIDRFSQPFGPWHIVVPTASLSQARDLAVRPND